MVSFKFTAYCTGEAVGIKHIQNRFELDGVISVFASVFQSLLAIRSLSTSNTNWDFRFAITLIKILFGTCLRQY